MQDIDATAEGGSLDSKEAMRQQLWDLAVKAFRRLILFISFGPGVLGFVWLLGKIFRR